MLLLLSSYAPVVAPPSDPALCDVEGALAATMPLGALTAAVVPAGAVAAAMPDGTTVAVMPSGAVRVIDPPEGEVSCP